MSDVRSIQAPRLPARALDAHKGDSGRLLVIGGAVGWTGAPALAARGALASGVGLLTVAVPEDIRGEVSLLVPAAMVRAVRSTMNGTCAAIGAKDVIALGGAQDGCVIGPGIGNSDETRAFVARVVRQVAVPVVVDADALNGMATGGIPRREAVVATPHPGEAARLLGCTAAEIQADREGSARRLAERFSVVVLKGAGTLVTDGRRIVRNDTGNAGLATGGTGDVLAGVIGALLASGLDPFDAACAGVFLHGAAADAIAKKHGERAVSVSALVAMLPRVVARHVA